MEKKLIFILHSIVVWQGNGNIKRENWKDAKVKPARVIIAKEYIFFYKSTWNRPNIENEKLNPYRRLIKKYLKH